MTATIPSIEPEFITAGDTLKFTKSLPDYVAPTWVLTYALVKDAVQIAITASDNGDDDHLVNVAPATTAAWTTGVYSWNAYVTNTDRYLIGSGFMEVKPDFAALTSGYDARKHCKIVLDALEATIEGKATKDQLSYSISFGDGGASRSISRMGFAELIEARLHYRGEYKRLERQARVDAGLDSRRTIHARIPV